MSSSLPASNDFARLLHPATERGRLQLGVELAVSLVVGCDHASVTVLTPHYVETVAASDDVVRQGDGWQQDLSEGPSLDSVRTRVPVVSQDLGSDPRWRSWGPRVADSLGLRAMMSVVLQTGTGTDTDVVGCLNLYADRVQVWDAEQQRLALALGDQLVAAVAGARVIEARGRAMIERIGLVQAQGIVMERYRMTAEQALDHLRQLSRATEVPMVHLTERIVATRELPVLRAPGDLHP